MDAEFDELVRKGKKTQNEVEGMKQLAAEVQYAVLTRKLEPGGYRGLSLTAREWNANGQMDSHENVLQQDGIPASWRCACSNLSRYGAYDGSRGQLGRSSSFWIELATH